MNYGFYFLKFLSAPQAHQLPWVYVATWNSRPILHTTCTTSNISKVLQQEQGLKQHKYNETSLGSLAIKKQGVEEMAKLVLE